MVDPTMPLLDDQEMVQLGEQFEQFDVQAAEKRIDQMELELDDMHQRFLEELPQLHAQLEAKFWKKIKKAASSVANKVTSVAKKVATTAVKVGGKIVEVAKSVWDAAKNKLAEIVNKMKDFIRELEPMELIKSAVDKFFTLTDSKAFRTAFKKWITPIAKSVPMTSKEVGYTMNIIYREFWEGQIWFWKWIFNGLVHQTGFITSFRNAVDADFKKAGKACTKFAEVCIGVGAFVKGMGKYMPTFPAVATAGTVLKAGGKIAKPLCRLFPLLSKLVGTYNTARSLFSKVGIKLPASF